MNQVHGSETSGEGARQILRYRLAVIGVFLIALLSAGLLDRAWHGQLAPRGGAVQSTR